MQITFIISNTCFCILAPSLVNKTLSTTQTLSDCLAAAVSLFPVSCREQLMRKMWDCPHNQQGFLQPLRPGDLVPSERSCLGFSTILAVLRRTATGNHSYLDSFLGKLSPPPKSSSVVQGPKHSSLSYPGSSDGSQSFLDIQKCILSIEENSVRVERGSWD